MKVIYRDFFTKKFSYHHSLYQNNRIDEDSQDVFQEEIIVLVHKVKDRDFITYSIFIPYLFSISKNIWIRNLRNNKFINTEQFDNNRQDIEFTDENKVSNYKNKILKWLNLITKHFQQILRAIFFSNQPIEGLMIKMRWKNKHTASNQKYKCIQQLKKVKEKDE